jgi:DNA processing protein
MTTPTPTPADHSPAPRDPTGPAVQERTRSAIVSAISDEAPTTIDHTAGELTARQPGSRSGTAECAAPEYPIPTSTSTAERHLAAHCAIPRITPPPNPSDPDDTPANPTDPDTSDAAADHVATGFVADPAAATQLGGSRPTEARSAAESTRRCPNESGMDTAQAVALDPATTSEIADLAAAIRRAGMPSAAPVSMKLVHSRAEREHETPEREPSETFARQVKGEPVVTQPFGEEIRLARAYLMRVAEPPATALLAFVDAVGPVAAAARVRAAEVPAAVLAETSARRHLDLAAGDLADAEQVGARLVVPEDEEWPAWQLLCLAAAVDRGQRWSGAPLGLWARGPASMTDVFDRAVSVVGSRAATSYGEHVAAEVGHGLASADMTVVSGAAYGIDGSAHRGALTAEGRTVAVLACGVDVDYPSGHAALLERIADTGLVLSEYPPGTKPAKHRFLVRNRIIAALSTGTVVVEAGVRSGARNTATTAAALGKVVMAVPGPITSAMSVGCHDLLRTGVAILAGSVAEILEALGPVGEHLSERPDGPHRRTDGLGDDALRVHEALRRRTARTTAQVAVDSGVPLDRVRALLPELEITGLAERCEEGWCQAPD